MRRLAFCFWSEQKAKGGYQQKRLRERPLAVRVQHMRLAETKSYYFRRGAHFNKTKLALLFSRTAVFSAFFLWAAAVRPTLGTFVIVKPALRCCHPA